MLGPPLALGWRGLANAGQQSEAECGDTEAVDGTTSTLEDNRASRTEEGAQRWMVQPSALPQASGSDTTSHSADGDAADESKGMLFFSRRSQHGLGLPARSVSTAPSTKQDLAVLPVRRREVDSVGNEARPSGVLSRRRTVPSNMPTAGGAESPLLRLLGATGDSSWHTQRGRGRASQPLAKRARGTEFWDAQLMR